MSTFKMQTIYVILDDHANVEVKWHNLKA